MWKLKTTALQTICRQVLADNTTRVMVDTSERSRYIPVEGVPIGLFIVYVIGMSHPQYFPLYLHRIISILLRNKLCESGQCVEYKYKFVHSLFKLSETLGWVEISFVFFYQLQLCDNNLKLIDWFWCTRDLVVSSN